MTKKYGTTLTFEALSVDPLKYRTNPDGGETADYQYYYYYQCTQVKDRYGFTLTYDGDDTTLIPSTITASDGRTITITTDDTTGCISSIEDPLGNTTNYTYTQKTVDTWTLNLLTEVDRPEGQTIKYAYTDPPSVITDTNPRFPWIGFGEFLQCNLVSITTAMGGDTPDQVYTFAYAQDESYADYSNSESGASQGWYTVCGLPMIVSKVTLPYSGDTAVTASFSTAIVGSTGGLKVENYGGGSHLVGHRR